MRQGIQGATLESQEHPVAVKRKKKKGLAGNPGETDLELVVGNYPMKTKSRPGQGVKGVLESS